MMAPTIALDRRGRPRLVVGSAGSARLRGAIMQIVVNVLEHGLGVDEAIGAPRVHVDEPHVHCEGGHDPAELDRLEALGYDVVRWRRRNLFFGGAAAVEVLADGSLAAAGDPRRGGAGVVVDVTIRVRAGRARRRRAALVALASAVGGRAGGLAARRLALAQRRATSAATSARCSATPTRRSSSPKPDGELVGRLSLMRDPHPASAHVADLGLMVAAAHRRARDRHGADARGGGVGARRAGDEARAARLPAQRARDRPLREARLRARGVSDAPLPAARRPLRRRDPDGEAIAVGFDAWPTERDPLPPPSTASRRTSRASRSRTSSASSGSSAS